jgi:hypothetical protein
VGIFGNIRDRWRRTRDWSVRGAAAPLDGARQQFGGEVLGAKVVGDTATVEGRWCESDDGLGEVDKAARDEARRRWAAAHRGTRIRQSGSDGTLAIGGDRVPIKRWEMHVPARLRVLDLRTRFFWLTVLFQVAWGRPWLEMIISRAAARGKTLTVWAWEPIPDSVSQTAVTLQRPVDRDAAEGRSDNPPSLHVADCVGDQWYCVNCNEQFPNTPEGLRAAQQDACPGRVAPAAPKTTLAGAAPGGPAGHLFGHGRGGERCCYCGAARERMDRAALTAACPDRKGAVRGR